MPAVRVESDALADLRFEALGKLLGADKYAALGRMIYVWSYCTSHEQSHMARHLVSHVVDPELLVRADLAEVVPDQPDVIRIKGTSGRIEWLGKLRKASQKGGDAHRAKWLPNGSQEPSPLTLALTPALAPTILREEKRSRRSRAAALSPYELSVTKVVLAKLGNQTGVRYMGGVQHQRLIAARIREGISECDLRKVICYCADKLAWREDPKMAAYLRPETLFGPQSIAKYLDAARTWFETLAPEDQPVPEAAAE